MPRMFSLRKISGPIQILMKQEMPGLGLEVRSTHEKDLVVLIDKT